MPYFRYTLLAFLVKALLTASEMLFLGLFILLCIYVYVYIYIFAHVYGVTFRASKEGVRSPGAQMPRTNIALERGSEEGESGLCLQSPG